MTLREARESLFEGIYKQTEGNIERDNWKWPPFAPFRSYSAPAATGCYLFSSRYIYERTGERRFRKWSRRMSEFLLDRIDKSPNDYLPDPQYVDRNKLSGLDINWMFSSLSYDLFRREEQEI